MIYPDKIIRTRFNRLSLTVDANGRLIVRAPNYISDSEIFEYIKQKEKWIVKKRQQIIDCVNSNKSILNWECILYLGEKYQIRQIKGLTKPEMTNDALLIPSTMKSQVVIRKFLIDKACQILIKRLNDISKKIKINYSSFKIINSKSKWGMCDTEKNIYINWKAIMLTPDLIDYIIYHELSHIVYMNHSDKFWNYVAKYVPNYNEKKEILKKSSFLIRLI